MAVRAIVSCFHESGLFGKYHPEILGYGFMRGREKDYRL